MADSKERAGYDQPDEYTGKNATFGMEPPPAYQPPAGAGYGQPAYQPPAGAGYGQPAYPPQAGGGYGQPAYSHQATTVVVNQPQQAIGVIIQPRAPDYMVSSILACLCCFWPTGLCAIYYANEANNLMRAGDLEGANRMSRSARNLVITSVILGIICISVSVVLRVVLYNETDNTYNSYK